MTDDTAPPSTPVYAILHFGLEDGEGERRLRECLDAPQVRSALWEYDNWLRGQIKHADRVELQPARDKLFEIFNEHDVSVWEE